MIKPVAIAIEDCHDKDVWSPYERIGHDIALECARAAMEALHLNLSDMINGSDAWHMAGVWNAMIDAELTDDPSQ